jgi:hypothetical protein
VSGIATGGLMPEGFLTEARPRPEFAEMFGADLPPRPGRVDPLTLAYAMTSDQLDSGH